MFSVMYEDEIYTRWSCEYVFETMKEAKTFLQDAGFIEQNRVFIRENHRWSTYIKAYITPLKVYKKNRKEDEENESSIHQSGN